MIIIGYVDVEYNPFYSIKSIDDIIKTPSNSTVVFKYSRDNLELCKHCLANDVEFALVCGSYEDILFANANGATYIVCEKESIQIAQKYADSYLFDAKILLYTSNADDLVWCADRAIDGILFKDSIKFVNFH
jgi:hypothetical protein